MVLSVYLFIMLWFEKDTYRNVSQYSSVISVCTFLYMSMKCCMHQIIVMVIENDIKLQ